MTPEFWNVRLSGRPFMPVGDPAYPDIVQRINGLKRDGDEFEIPDIAAAGCWDKLYRQYVWLRDRAAREAATAAPKAAALAQDVARWNTFLTNRENILLLISRGIFDVELLTEHLGLHENDLSDPVLPEANEFGDARAPGWKARAERLYWCLHRWGALSDEERSFLRMERVGAN